MGRSHSHHCLTCHDWTDGFSEEAKTGVCSCGGDLIYDLNYEGCPECWCPVCEGCAGVYNDLDWDICEACINDPGRKPETLTAENLITILTNKTLDMANQQRQTEIRQQIEDILESDLVSVADENFVLEHGTERNARWILNINAHKHPEKVNLNKYLNKVSPWAILTVVATSKVEISHTTIDAISTRAAYEEDLDTLLALWVAGDTTQATLKAILTCGDKPTNSMRQARIEHSMFIDELLSYTPLSAQTRKIAGLAELAATTNTAGHHTLTAITQALKTQTKT